MSLLKILWGELPAKCSFVWSQQLGIHQPNAQQTQLFCKFSGLHSSSLDIFTGEKERDACSGGKATLIPHCQLECGLSPE